MMEALKLCGNSALLLWKLKMIMHAMEQQRVFIGCDRPRLKTEKVGCGSETRCQVDHPQVPAIGNRHSHTATRRLQQIRPGDRRDGEEAPVFLFVDVATGWYWPLLVDRCKTERAMQPLLLFDHCPRELLFP